jgi:hypothetical protein
VTGIIMVSVRLYHFRLGTYSSSEFSLHGVYMCFTSGEVETMHWGLYTVDSCAINMLTAANV